jgi:hypothetical protein
VARQQAEELEHLRGEMQRLGVLDAVELRREADGLRGEIEAMRRDYAEQKALLDSELADLRLRVAVTQEEEILQEVGVYTYRHPLNDSVAYREQLKVLQDQIKATARRDGGAIEATTGWQVNGSAAQGRKMVNDFSKLMLRAYNAEADNLSRGMKPYKLATAIDRLEKVAVTIERLGKTMAIRVSPEYHRLRIKELELAADYQEMLAREKDGEREKREQLREERKLQLEIQRERERLHKEQQHYTNALAALEAKGDLEGAARMREQLGDIAKAIEDVDYRAANPIEGATYVIVAIAWLLLVPLAGTMSAGPGTASPAGVRLGTLVIDSDGVNVIMSLVFCLGATLFYVLLFRSRIVPRWIATWGLLGIPLYAAAYLLVMYGVVGINSSLVNLFGLPLAVQEMVLAVWMIARGFRPAAASDAHEG